ncbi:MAG: glutamyl-tRNA reductase [Flavobacteriales bacterium]
MEQLQIIALTHHNLPLDLIGRLHVDEKDQQDFLPALKTQLQFKELAFLSTCNRVEFIINSSEYICQGRMTELFSAFNFRDEELKQLLDSVEIYKGAEAVHHLMSVASSLESMVIGEREILAQVKKAFDQSRKIGNSGHVLNLISKSVVNVAKKVFTHTKISTKPVSVVSLAWHQFNGKNISIQAPILLIGAGQTIGNFARFLAKNGYKNVTVANRTIAKANDLCDNRKGWTPTSLAEALKKKSNFEAIVTCTGADEPLLFVEDFKQITSEKFSCLIDIALPADTHEDLIHDLGPQFIGMSELKEQADKNIAERSDEKEACESILQDGMVKIEQQFREREIELSMREIPALIKEIKSTAVGEVFAKDLENLDETSREVLEKILQYMEKKYISLPMKMAKEVLLNKTQNN